MPALLGAAVTFYVQVCVTVWVYYRRAGHETEWASSDLVLFAVPYGLAVIMHMVVLRRSGPRTVVAAGLQVVAAGLAALAGMIVALGISIGTWGS